MPSPCPPPVAAHRFPMAKNAITPKQMVIIQLVIPGPVVKLRTKNASTRWLVELVDSIASRAKLNMCAMMWTTDQKTMDQPVALWNEILLWNGIISLRGVLHNRKR